MSDPEGLTPLERQKAACAGASYRGSEGGRAACIGETPHVLLTSVRFTLAAALGLATVAAAIAPAMAQDYKAGTIRIEAPWLRATPAGAEVAGGYMKLSEPRQRS